MYILAQNIIDDHMTPLPGVTFGFESILAKPSEDEAYHRIVLSVACSQVAFGTSIGHQYHASTIQLASLPNPLLAEPGSVSLHLRRPRNSRGQSIAVLDFSIALHIERGMLLSFRSAGVPPVLHQAK